MASSEPWFSPSNITIYSSSCNCRKKYLAVNYGLMLHQSFQWKCIYRKNDAMKARQLSPCNITYTRGFFSPFFCFAKQTLKRGINILFSPFLCGVEGKGVWFSRSWDSSRRGQWLNYDVCILYWSNRKQRECSKEFPACYQSSKAIRQEDESILIQKYLGRIVEFKKEAFRLPVYSPRLSSMPPIHLRMALI